MKFLKWFIGIIFLVSLVAFDYAFPEKQIYEITGTEVKRHDKEKSKIVDDGSPSSTYDVYYVFTEHDGGTRVFRNEDRLFYVKWNSADIQGRASSAQKSGSKVLITSYGWRNSYLQWFPNIVELELLTDEEASSVSTARWTSFFWMIFFVLYFGLFIWGSIRLIRFFNNNSASSALKSLIPRIGTKS